MTQNYRVGDIVEGIVTYIMPYGAFIHVDDKTSGLVHISEIHRGFVNRIEDFLQVGQFYDFRILQFDSQRRHLRLSYKQVGPYQRNRKQRRYLRNLNRSQLLPDNNIGFKSLENQLPLWIKEQLDDND